MRLGMHPRLTKKDSMGISGGTSPYRKSPVCQPGTFPSEQFLWIKVTFFQANEVLQNYLCTLLGLLSNTI